MSSQVFYQNGAELAVLTNTFTTAAGPADPTAVTLVVTDPQGAITTWSYPSGPNVITRLSAGAYQVMQPVGTSDGLWGYTWIGTGTASDISPGTWRVFPVTLQRWYTSKEELKSRLGIDDDQDDFEITLAVQTAARWIEKRTGRFFYQSAETRTFVPESIYTAHIDDLVSLTTMFTDPDGDGTFPQEWAAGTDFELAYGYRQYNQNASGELRPYTQLHVIGNGSKFLPYIWPLTRADRIQITGVWGWPEVPAAVTTASLIVAAELFKIKDAPFGVQGFADFGMIRVQAGTQADFLLAPYVDPRRKVGVGV